MESSAPGQAFLCSIAHAGNGAEGGSSSNVQFIYDAEDVSHSDNETVVTLSAEKEKTTSWDGVVIEPSSIWLAVRSATLAVTLPQLRIPLTRWSLIRPKGRRPLFVRSLRREPCGDGAA